MAFKVALYSIIVDTLYKKCKDDILRRCMLNFEIPLILKDIIVIQHEVTLQEITLQLENPYKVDISGLHYSKIVWCTQDSLMHVNVHANLHIPL